MVNRDMTASVQTEVAKSKIKFFFLYEFYFDSGTLYLTSNAADLTWNSNTYTSAKTLGHSGNPESLVFEHNTINMTLTGVDTAILAYVTSEDFINRKFIIRKGYFDTNHAIISDPWVWFQGKLDPPTYNQDHDQQTATIEVEAGSDFRRFVDTNGLKTNAQDQRRYYSDDAFFNNVAGLASNLLRW